MVVMHRAEQHQQQQRHHQQQQQLTPRTAVDLHIKGV
jgi:hypothetical protein